MRFKGLQWGIICLTLCTILVSGLTISVSAATFPDVPENHWASGEIHRSLELGFFQGDQSGNFGVGRAMTRATFTVVLCRFFGWEMSEPTRPIYQDVPTDAWYASAVEAAYHHGALTDQRTEFRPSAPITREEVAVMLVRALGYGSIAGLTQDLYCPFQDVTTNIGYLTMAYDMGLMKGTSATVFAPDKTATREQVAVILVRLYDELYAPTPEKMAIVGQKESDEAVWNTLDVVALNVGQLVYSGDETLLSFPMGKENTTMMKENTQGQEAEVLLGVRGDTSVLVTASATEIASVLGKAVNDGGYDGVFLDIPKLQERDKHALTQLATEVRAAIGNQAFYLVVEAPSWQGKHYDGYDYAALGNVADRLVLRLSAYQTTGGSLPIAPVEPLEEVYYTLARMGEVVDVNKLSLMLTAGGTLYLDGVEEKTLTGQEITALLSDETVAAHYSNRYSCAYLTMEYEGKNGVVWYLNEESIRERVRMMRLFRVNQLCVSDLSAMQTDWLDAVA